MEAARLVEHGDARLYPADGPKLGIQKKVSWHTFRHIFSSILKGSGEDVKAVQELLRHSTSRMTLDTYTQALGHDPTDVDRARDSRQQNSEYRRTLCGIGSTSGGPPAVSLPIRRGR